MPEWFKGLTCYVRGCKSPVGSNPTRSANSIERKGAPAVIGRRLQSDLAWLKSKCGLQIKPLTHLVDWCIICHVKANW